MIRPMHKFDEKHGSVYFVILANEHLPSGGIERRSIPFMIFFV